MLTWLLAVALTAILVELARRVALKVGLVDTPTDRKSHQGEIPLVGGIAIFLGLVPMLLFFKVVQDHWAFLVAAAALVVVGVWDDMRGIPPLLRLFLQSAAVLFVAYFGDAFLLDLGIVIPGNGPLELGWMAIPFTVFAGVGLINAFNMADGVDGVCATFVLVALTGLGIMALVGGNQNALVLVIVLAAGVVGFLLFNLRVPGRKHAKAFLGDAGSYLLGLSVLYLTIRLSQGEGRAMAPISALWFCMLPLFDTIGMILRRIKRGKSPFSADREHIHHVFLLAKFSVAETWVGLTIVAIVGLGVGLFASLSQVSETTMIVAFVAASILYYWMLKRAWRVMRFLSRSINRRAAAFRDRRKGADRREGSVVHHLKGLPDERRSGEDRRCVYDDRRSDDQVVHDDVTKIAV